MNSETELVTKRYARRNVGDRYSMLRPEVWQSTQERQRTLLHLFKHTIRWDSTTDKTLLEVGCGGGGNLLEFLRSDFAPQNLSGIELLHERVVAAKYILPPAIAIHEGDASTVNIAANSQDVVFQSVVFSSLLDDDFQQVLADQMWQWVKPGGGVLWYDFTYNNPSNPDVRGISVKRVRELFPKGKQTVKRVTLAPPISRRVCKLHPNAYYLFNAIPWLRTHVLIWIEKPMKNVP